MPAGFTLAPQSPPRSRPIGDVTFRNRPAQSFFIHPGKHQHRAGFDVLRNGRHKALRVKPDRSQKLLRRQSLAQARTPRNDWVPNIPSLTEPVMASPSTVAENSSVIAIGLVIEAFQLI